MNNDAPHPNPMLVERLSIELEKFNKLRVGYIPDTIQEVDMVVVKKSTKSKQDKEKSKSLIERFLFSDYA